MTEKYNLQGLFLEFYGIFNKKNVRWWCSIET